MPSSESNPQPDGAITRAFAENCRGSLLWSLWACGLAADLLSEPEGDIARRLRTDAAYAALARETHKMLLVERSGARVREHIVARMIEVLEGALRRSGRMPSGGPLEFPIDFSILPEPDDIRGEDIASLRPVVADLLRCDG